tara:strand:- start:234 stop:668 length:435 start_codon:yes stop_codon:yes gene_type:complete
MSLIKKSRLQYDKMREPRMVRLRRSSRHPSVETGYVKNYNMEEHILYRKEEIKNVYETYQYYQNSSEIIYWLGKNCLAYREESSYDMLGIYLIGDSNIDETIDSKKIMECRLNIKDKNMTKVELYQLYCVNLLDDYSYQMLSNV